MFTPAEFSLGGVYMPPMFVSLILGVVLAIVTAKWLNRKRLSHYLFYPPLVFVAITTIYTVLIGTFIIPG